MALTSAPAAQRFGAFVARELATLKSLTDPGPIFCMGQHSVRQPHPFDCHFALNGTRFLIPHYDRHVQAMRGKTRVFFVFIAFRNGHDTSCTIDAGNLEPFPG
jgi:hypothetical protein